MRYDNRSRRSFFQGVEESGVVYAKGPSKVREGLPYLPSNVGRYLPLVYAYATCRISAIEAHSGRRYCLLRDDTLQPQSTRRPPCGEKLRNCSLMAFARICPLEKENKKETGDGRAKG